MSTPIDDSSVQPVQQHASHSRVAHLQPYTAVPLVSPSTDSASAPPVDDRSRNDSQSRSSQNGLPRGAPQESNCPEVHRVNGQQRQDGRRLNDHRGRLPPEDADSKSQESGTQGRHLTHNQRERQASQPNHKGPTGPRPRLKRCTSLRPSYYN